jgi:hypothetical protein
VETLLRLRNSAFPEKPQSTDSADVDEIHQPTPQRPPLLPPSRADRSDDNSTAPFRPTDPILHHHSKKYTMAPLQTMSRALARSAAASARLPAVRAVSSTPALRDASSSSSFESPFKGESKSSRVPDFSKYMSKGKGSSNALISYFMVGTLGAISAAGAKSTVQGE